MNKSYFFPILLIVIGSVLLLNQFDLIEFSTPYILILGSFIIGGLMLRKAYLSTDKKGLFGGTFFTVLGLIFFLLLNQVIPYYDPLIMGLIILDMGVSNMVYYLFTRKSINHVTYAVIFAMLSVPLIMMYYASLSYPDMIDIFLSYWPVLLITAGLGFLMEGLVKKTK